jgi:CheY-like chemotaxis protein
MATILIVEDDFDLQYILKVVFSNNGYRTEATDGEVGPFFEPEHKQPDLVLLDMELNNRDGCEICRTIKDNTRTHHIPVIMMSANVDAEKRCMEAGADDFLPKPLNQNVLLRSIKERFWA